MRCRCWANWGHQKKMVVPRSPLGRRRLRASTPDRFYLKPPEIYIDAPGGVLFGSVSNGSADLLSLLAFIFRPDFGTALACPWALKSVFPMHWFVISLLFLVILLDIFQDGRHCHLRRVSLSWLNPLINPLIVVSGWRRKTEARLLFQRRCYFHFYPPWISCISKIHCSRDCFWVCSQLHLNPLSSIKKTTNLIS